MGIIDPKTCCQVCIVARDIEKTAAQYADLFGVPAPEIMGIQLVEETDITYRGKPTQTQARLCVFDMGQVVL